MALDDIPVAQRQPSARVVQEQRSQAQRRRWMVLLGLLIGLLFGFSLLRSRPPAQPTLVEASVAEQAEPIPVGSPEAVLGHFAFGEAPESDLIVVGAFQGRSIRMRQSAGEQLKQMMAAAQQGGVSLVLISGFRTLADQQHLFFDRAQAQSLRPVERASVSAPPGYSEHHTGYAVDIGDGTAPQTHLQISFESTVAFQWLQANAARFGFELSFPRDNSQGVSYEPWHWRFVGDRQSLETFYAKRGTAPQP